MEHINYSYIVIIGLSLIIGLVVYLLAKSLKKGKYDSTKQQVVLEEIRNSLENQLYSINERLIQNEERWRDVNHLLIGQGEASQQSFAIEKRTAMTEFLKANGIKENDLIVKPRQVFVLTPFNDKFSEDYQLIKQTCLDNGFDGRRGDETFFKGDIFPQMLKLIVSSRLIIANINGRNPNVFYELGIAQALDKPVLLIAHREEKLPIDIRSNRFLIYSSDDELRGSLALELRKLRID